MSSHSTSLEPKSQLTIDLDPGWEYRSLPSEEKKRERNFPIKRVGENKERKFPNKDWEKAKKQKRKKGKKIPDQGSKEKEICRKVFWTRQYLNNTELSPRKHEKKGNHDLKWSSLFDCRPKSCASVTCSPRPKQKIEKEKAKNIQSQNPTKPPFPRKSPTDPWSRM